MQICHLSFPEQLVLRLQPNDGGRELLNRIQKFLVVVIQSSQL